MSNTTKGYTPTMPTKLYGNQPVKIVEGNKMTLTVGNGSEAHVSSSSGVKVSAGGSLPPMLQTNTIIS